MDAKELVRDVALWDVPVRIVHWGTVILLPGLWWTAQNGHLDLHVMLGQVMLGLIVFRVVWGFVGSATARFSQFVSGPAKILAFLRAPKDGAQAETVGHNPLGALSVVGLLALLLSQALLGLFAQDTDAVASGPLNHLVSWDVAVLASKAHGIVFNLLLAFVALHIAAIGYYRLVRKSDLITPMVTGRKTFPKPVTAPSIASLRRALIVAIVVIGVVMWVRWGLPPWGAYFPWDQPAAQPGVLAEESYM